MSARRLVTPALPLLACALFAVTSCGGPAEPAGPAPAASAPAPTPTGADFTIQGYRFPPLTATPGQTLTFADADDEPHTVTADDGSFDTSSFDSSAPGTMVAPTAPGDYPVHCAVHPFMHGTLTVR